MKRILYTCLAALAAACAAPGAEDSPAAAPNEAAAEPAEASASEEAAAGDESAGELDVIDRLRSKLEKSQEEFARLKKPSRSIQSRFSRHVEEGNARLRKLQDYKKQADERAQERQAMLGVEYVYSIVPVEERDKYEREGGEMCKQTLNALMAKSETTQIEGLKLFEALRESYQGLPAYKEALSQYQKVVAKCDKKWTMLRESMRRERLKWPQNRLDKTQEAEAAQYEALARKMEADERDIDEEWFVPKVSNSVMLDRALERVKRAKSMLNKSGEAVGDVPKLMNSFWAEMDEAKSLLQQGNIEAAAEKLSEDSSYRELVSQSRYALSDEYKEGIRKQYEDFRNELRKRQSSLRSIERAETNALSGFEREAQHLESRLDAMLDTLTEEKEEEDRRAAEAAEAAAREAERLAEEERENAQEADDADDQPAKKPKKKKGKKKDKAE